MIDLRIFMKIEIYVKPDKTRSMVCLADPSVSSFRTWKNAGSWETGSHFDSTNQLEKAFNALMPKYHQRISTPSISTPAMEKVILSYNSDISEQSIRAMESILSRLSEKPL